MTQTQQARSAEPSAAEPLATLAYHDAPIGDVVASEAALAALRRTRPWALLCAIGMFAYALIGGGMGLVWLVVAIRRAGDPSFPLYKFIVLIPPNLVGAALALAGGVLALMYHAAAGRAHARRSSADLERALLVQGRIWRWAAVTVIALFALPVIIAAIGAFLGVW